MVIHFTVILIKPINIIYNYNRWIALSGHINIKFI